MAEFMDPYTGSAQHTDDSKRRLLEAVATAGTAGKKAFEDAQAGINASQQAALQRAQQSAQMFGGGAERFGAGDLATRFDLQKGNLASAGAEFAAQNAAMGAAGSSYMDKVQAALGALKGQNEAKTSEYGAQIEAYKARLEAEAKAAAEAAAAKEAAEMARLRMREEGENARARMREAGEESRAQKARTNNITLDQLIGGAKMQRQANPIQTDTGNILANVKGGEKILAADLTERARNLGNALGVDPYKLMGLEDPGFQKNLLSDLGYKETDPKTMVPTTFDKNWLTNTFVNYDGKKISSSRADEVLRAPELQTANQFLGTLVNTRIVNGRIDDQSAGEFNGLTPKDAFWRWVGQQPGIKTMKTALLGYYTPFVESLGR